jgi:SAM-dependent methyltransferase
MKYNRILNINDLIEFKKIIEEKRYSITFPHIDLWTKDDAILKWISIIEEITTIQQENLKIVDLGCCDGCVPHILSYKGHDVTGIDIQKVNHLCVGSKAKLIVNDVFSELKNFKDNDVNVFVDSCAVTHFDTKFSNSIYNFGWEKVGKEIYRILKNNGKFVITTDCNTDNDFGEFIKPIKIIEILESCGLKLDAPYENQYENTDFYFNYNSQKLKVVSLAFVK